MWEIRQHQHFRLLWGLNECTTFQLRPVWSSYRPTAQWAGPTGAGCRLDRTKERHICTCWGSRTRRGHRAVRRWGSHSWCHSSQRHTCTLHSTHTKHTHTTTSHIKHALKHTRLHTHNRTHKGDHRRRGHVIHAETLRQQTEATRGTEDRKRRGQPRKKDGTPTRRVWIRATAMHTGAIGEGAAWGEVPSITLTHTRRQGGQTRLHVCVSPE